MTARRRSTLRRVRATAAEAHKSFELEHRIGRLEVVIRDLRAANDMLIKRAAAMQAQLDHLDAKLNRR